MEKKIKLALLDESVDEPMKEYVMAEIPPGESESEKRGRLIDELCTETATRFPAPIIGNAVSSVMQLTKTCALIDGYDSWKLLTMFLAGKLSAYEGAKNKKGEFDS